jgi:hypothetical protein
MPNKTDGQHALFVHIGIWRRAFMRENILWSVLDVCQNMFDSQFLGVMAGSQFGISSRLGRCANDALNLSGVHGCAALILRVGIRLLRSLLLSPLLTIPHCSRGVVISACNVQAANPPYLILILHAAFAPSGAYSFREFKLAFGSIRSLVSEEICPTAIAEEVSRRLAVF